MRFLLTFLLLMAVAVPAAELKFKDTDRVLIFGASNIWFGAYRPYGMAELFRQGLTAAGCKAAVLATGHPGEGTITFVNGRLEKAMDWAKPTWLLLTAGGNDAAMSFRKTNGYTPEIFEPNMIRLIEMAHARGVKVALITGTAGVEDAEAIAREDANAEILRKIAREKKLPLIDLYARLRAELAAHPEQPLHIDKIHLNGIGYRIFAEEMLKWAGVSESTIAAQRPGWNKIPSMTLYLNNAHVPTDLVSADDYGVIHREAVKRGVTVEAYVRQILQDKISELRKY